MVSDWSFKISRKEMVGKKTYLFIKRFFDILCSFLGIILLSPVFLILALVVKCDSKGPVFFAHGRLGYKGKIIQVYKFRTMVLNAEELINELPEEQKKEFQKNFKLKNDPRITKVGKFLRKTSLDELPQLLNIFKGDLSIVGPRPIVEKEKQLYGNFGDKLLTVKPGLTGYWQINGRSDTTYEERVELDREYVKRRSLRLDFLIILKTFVEVFKGRGAE